MEQNDLLAICGVSCALQFTFVRHHQILAGRLVGLEPWVAASPNSVMFALDKLGFFLQGLATLFLAPLFAGRRLTNTIRRLLVVNGIDTIGLIVLTGVMSFSSASGETLYRATTVVWAAVLTTALLLVAEHSRVDCCRALPQPRHRVNRDACRIRRL